MTFAKFKDWAFLALMAGLGSMGVSSIHDMSNSVQSLNEKMSTIIAQQSAQGVTTSSLSQGQARLEDRVTYLEHELVGLRERR